MSGAIRSVGFDEAPACVIASLSIQLARCLLVQRAGINRVCGSQNNRAGV